MIRNNYGKWEVPKDYIIEYDKNKDYNEVNNPKGYLPPYRSDFKSIYEGIEIEMHIVDHCNLNCNCCNHFSPLAKPNYVSLEDFQEQVIELKNNIPNIKTFLILGGEPTLHPQLFEICMSAREILGPEVYIDVLSNGTIIDKIAAHKEEYLKNNIIFTFSSYYNRTKLKEIEQLKPLGRIYNTRIISKQTLVQPYGDLDAHFNFFNCVNHKLPCFTLKNHKLFICPFSAHINLYCEYTNEKIPLIKDKDYLLVSEIQNNLDKIQTFCFTPKPICGYCKPGPSVPYTDSMKDKKEFELTINELYFRDYPRYEKIMNSGKNGLINWATNKDLNPGRVDYIYEPHTLNTQLLRYKTGKIDIIIPYYNETKDQLIALKENLLKQTIIKDCVIYLISDKSNMDQCVLKTFNKIDKLHCVFLRNEEQLGPGGARNKGIENSYSPYLIFFDADNAFIKDTALEEIYNKAMNYDLVSWTSYNNQRSQQNFCVKREVLNNNNLRYKNIYFGEDSEFYIKLSSIIKKEKYFNYYNSENIFIKYNATANRNITSTFIRYDNLHFSFLTANFIGLLEAEINNRENYLIEEDAFLNHIIRLSQEHTFLIQNIFIRALIWYELYKLKEKNPYIVNNNNYKTLFKLFEIEQFEDIHLVIIYLSNYIKEHYLNKPKLYENAIYMLKLFEE